MTLRSSLMSAMFPRSPHHPATTPFPLLLATTLLLLSSSAIQPASAASPCGFVNAPPYAPGPGTPTVPSVNTPFLYEDDEGQSGLGIVAISIAQNDDGTIRPGFVEIVVILPDGAPIDGKTYIQYTIFNGLSLLQSWADTLTGKARNCNYQTIGLQFFIKWGNETAISTLPAGSQVKFLDSNSNDDSSNSKYNYVVITQPLETPKLPFWNIPLSYRCEANPPGGFQLSLRVYNKDLVSLSPLRGDCVENARAVLPFYFAWNCGVKQGE